MNGLERAALENTGRTKARLVPCAHGRAWVGLVAAEKHCPQTSAIVLDEDRFNRRSQVEGCTVFKRGALTELCFNGQCNGWTLFALRLFLNTANKRLCTVNNAPTRPASPRPVNELHR
eukprot:1188456-Prorocentrum_minimum.AAC.4